MKPKRIVILVIASLERQFRLFLIEEIWAYLINIANQSNYLDIYLLFDNDKQIEPIKHLSNNIIIDRNKNFNKQHLCLDKEVKEDDWLGGRTPGILSKTIYALRKLVNNYDVFYRTNLTSIPHLTNLITYINNHQIHYSGFNIWKDALRKHLTNNNSIKFPINKCLRNLNDISHLQGNCFVGGSGIFLNRDEVINILNQSDKIRYDIVDDISIGLLIDKCYHVNYLEPELDSELGNPVLLAKSPRKKYNRLKFIGRNLKYDEDTYLQMVDNQLEKLDNVLDIRMQWKDQQLPLVKMIWKKIKAKLPSQINDSIGFGHKSINKTNKF